MNLEEEREQAVAEEAAKPKRMRLNNKDHADLIHKRRAQGDTWENIAVELGYGDKTTGSVRVWRVWRKYYQEIGDPCPGRRRGGPKPKDGNADTRSSARLPWSEGSTAEEVQTAVIGKTITWMNKISDTEQEARTGKRVVLREGPRGLYIEFNEVGGGMRTVVLSTIIRVR